MGLRKAQIFITFALLSLVYAQNVTCPENEEYKCESNCVPTCQNKNTIPCGPCTKKCSCIEGYLREGPGGMCVPQECKDVPICKKHEKFTTCPSACPRICDEIYPNYPPFCTRLCLRIGCVCENGFIRETAGGECILEGECKQKCEENAAFNNCGSACPSTCSMPVRRCGEICAKGCFCNKGYILNDSTKKCVEKEKCPKI